MERLLCIYVPEQMCTDVADILDKVLKVSAD
jgi:hypothetical protein